MRGLCCILFVAACGEPVIAERAAAVTTRVRVNVLLRGPATAADLSRLGAGGRRPIEHVFRRIPAVTVIADAGDLPAIQALPFVAAANVDAPRTPQAAELGDGFSYWALDALDVTDALHDPRDAIDPFNGNPIEDVGSGRAVPYDGTGVYVGVLDSGLGMKWRAWFPEERIAADLARAFAGGGMDHGAVPDLPGVWEHDTVGHGTAVTAAILGYDLFGTPLNGAAPGVTAIPVKVCWGPPPGSCWSSVTTRGLEYLTELKASGALGEAPLVINISLGGPADFIERAAIDDAIAHGVIVVAGAGNDGEAGMVYPGGYPPVISPGGVGLVRQWSASDAYWFLRDVAEADTAELFVTGFSGRELPGQDLDVLAPAVSVPLPWAGIPGKLDLGWWLGNSFSGPYVAGVAALLLQKDPALRQEDVEAILEATALPMAAGCRPAIVDFPTGVVADVCWGADAVGHGVVQAAAALAAVGP
jgi:subtilisin family serine protease